MLSDRLVDTHVLVSPTEDFTGPDTVECAFIEIEGQEVIVNLTCPDYTMGRYVTLLRNASGPDSYLIHICEVEVTGMIGNFVFFKINANVPM